MKAGDKVVCVDDAPRGGSLPLSLPSGFVKTNTVYAVNGHISAGTRAGDVRITEARLIIVGVPVLYLGLDIGWQADRFRLVSEIGHPPIEVEQLLALHHLRP